MDPAYIESARKRRRFLKRSEGQCSKLGAMRWQDDGDNRNVEDVRGQSGGGGGGSLGGGGGRMRLGLGGMVVVGVLSLVLKRNLFADLGASGTPAAYQGGSVGAQGARPADEEPLAAFTKFVFHDAQRVWTSEFQKQGKPYQNATLVLFTDSVRSGCGFAESAMGPFYCPADQKVYVDLGFYRELKQRFRAPGDFAQAYVVAHEVGHHVQGLLGIEERVRREQRTRPEQKNALSVRMELQADCFAGVWAHSTERRKLLEQGDVEEGLSAAEAVGDDRIQKEATGRVNPERWTHGSSKERASWFRKGFANGQVTDCDTFK
jgi:uncharacterized protein